MQGYNGITIAYSGSQIIVSAEAIGSGPKCGCFPEMPGCLEETMKEKMDNPAYRELYSR